MITDQQPPHTPAEGAPTGQHAPRRRPVVIAVMAVALLAVIAGAIWGVTHSTAGTASHTTQSTTATAAPRVLYQADWSHGAAGWKLPSQAKIVEGHLVLDGNGLISVEIPYVPTTRNYAVDMDFQIQAVTPGGHFDLTAFNAAGERQYIAEMECTPMHQGAWNPKTGGCPGAVLVTARGGAYPSGLFTSDYVVGPGPKTFHLELKGDTVNFCPVNDCLVPVSAQPIDPSSHIFIEARSVKLLVTRVSISTI